MARRIVVELVGDSRKLEQAFARSSKSAAKFQREIGRVSGRRGGIFGGIVGQAAALTGVTAGIATLGGVVRAAFSEMGDAQKVAAQTGAVLKSTGAVAGVTADDVDKLATSISNYSGQDDEAVQAGENMLLTFTQIRDSVGQNNDVFTQATKVTADLAQAMGLDMTRAALQVGKALNDPARGYARLQRIGVAFTKTQIAQIKGFQKVGDVAAAQKVILAELNKEFGGSARAFGETLPGKIARLQESLRNLGGQLATQLVPALTRVVDRLLAWVQNTQNQQQVINTFKDAVSVLSTVLGGLKSAFELLNDVTGSTKNSLKLLLATFAAFKTLQLVGTLATIATNIGLIGTSAAATAPKLVALRAALLSVALNPLTILGAGAIIATKVLATKFAQAQKQMLEAQSRTFKQGAGVETTLVPRLAKQIDQLKQLGKSGAEILRTLRRQLGGGASADKLIEEAFRFRAGNTPELNRRIQKAARDKTAAAKKTAVAAVDAELSKPAGATVQQRNQWFDQLIGRQLGRVQDVGSLQGQLAQLDRIGGLISARIAKTKDITRKLTLEEQLLDIRRQKKGLREQLAQGFMDSLQFAVDKAGLTAGLADDLAALDALLAALDQRIARETDVGKKLQLEEQRLGVLTQRRQIREQLGQQVLDVLQLKLDRAGLTAGVADDLRALDALIRELDKRIAREADVIKRMELENEKLQLINDRAAKRQELVEKQRERRAARQFGALGLGPTGEERTPSVAAIRRQVDAVQRALAKAGELTPANRRQLSRLRQVLSGSFGQVAEDVRAKMKQILDDLFASIDKIPARVAAAGRKIRDPLAESRRRLQAQFPTEPAFGGPIGIDLGHFDEQTGKWVAGATTVTEALQQLAARLAENTEAQKEPPPPAPPLPPGLLKFLTGAATSGMVGPRPTAPATITPLGPAAVFNYSPTIHSNDLREAELLARRDFFRARQSARQVLRL